MVVRKAILLTSLCYLAACQGADDVSFKPGGGSDRTSGFGTAQQGADLTLDSNNDYPITEYYGNGTLVSINRNPIQVKTRQEAQRDRITSYTTQFSSSDSHVDQRVRNLVGQTSYPRVPKDELARRGREGTFKNVPFLMFVSASKAENGNGTSSTTFSDPAPFLVLPTQMHLYDELKQGPIEYNYNVTGDGDFSVRATVEEESRSGDMIRIKILSDIAADTDGKLYDKFSMPRSATYEIDTKEKKITKIDTETYYYNDRKKKRRDMNINFRLCRYMIKGKVDDQRPCGG